MELRELAIEWKRRKRSGKFIMHGVPAVRFCARCGGYVSKWHEHYTKPKEAVIAQSLWISPEDPPK